MSIEFKTKYKNASKLEAIMPTCDHILIDLETNTGEVRAGAWYRSFEIPSNTDPQEYAVKIYYDRLKIDLEKLKQYALEKGYVVV